MEEFDSSHIKILRVNLKGHTYSWNLMDPLEYVSYPIVYILYNREELYVGETTNLIRRFSSHNTDLSKKHLNRRLIIFSDYFNKSVTLHLESYLIAFFSGDKKFKILNGNLGMATHNYYKRASYENVFSDLWKALIDMNLAGDSVANINNSNNFKYSPYKILNVDQQEKVIMILDGLLNNKKTFIVNGIAGTGKTALATYILKLLITPIAEVDLADLDDAFSNDIYKLTLQIQERYPNLKDEIALVIPMPSLRFILKETFVKIPHLSPDLVISPSEAARKKYRFLIVDEAHRLRRRMNIFNYRSFDNINGDLGLLDGDELDWIMSTTDSKILFYDRNQVIKPADVLDDKFNGVLAKNDTISLELTTQIRSKGGNLYSNFVNSLMNSTLPDNVKFASNQYDLFLVDNISDFRYTVLAHNNEVGLSRMVAGYAWDWKSKTDSSLFDIEIDQVSFRWNSTDVDWINSINSIEEIGTIHNTQGYDLNYTGIIFGKEIGYDHELKEFIIRSDQYKDITGKRGATPADLKKFIINIYRTLMLRGIEGTYIYCCDKDLKEYFRNHITTLVV